MKVLLIVINSKFIHSNLAVKLRLYYWRWRRKTYREFIEYKLGKISINDIRGLYYKENGEVIANGKRPLMNMDEIAFPYEEDEKLDNKIVYYE